jgi:hypothetical protein
MAGKPNSLKKIPSQCRSAHQNSHTDWPGNEPGTPRRKADDFYGIHVLELRKTINNIHNCTMLHHEINTLQLQH